MARPPKFGTLSACTLRWPGSSCKFFALEIFITGGIIRYTTASDKKKIDMLLISAVDMNTKIKKTFYKLTKLKPHLYKKIEILNNFSCWLQQKGKPKWF